jgi:hypothetical protein
VKASINFLAYALLITIAQSNGDSNYGSYRDGYVLKKPIEELLNAAGVHMTNGGSIDELQQFQQYFSDYKIIVFDVLKSDRIF